MIKVRKKPARKQLETMISLINIVFLMLIFFLVAGQLAPPQDPEVTLSEAAEADSLPPPDALYVRADGTLVYREQPVTAEVYLRDHIQSSGTEEMEVRLGADETLKASDLLTHVSSLYEAGAKRVFIVTQRGQE